MEFPRHLVTAVLVAHNGAAWLPEALAALQWQRRPPQRVVAVDTGSGDESRRILERELGASSILEADDSLGFGAAVALALDAYAGAPEAPMPGRAGDAETVEWIWLLHDDCAPAPDALRHLLAVGEDSPSVGVIGPKVLAWDDPRVLIEIGFTIDTSGRRETGLERGELDQGQHDNVHDVLAVGTAGALIRRDVWDALGGFDLDLPLFRDDLDFCWRAHLAGHRVCVAPQATIRHASAAANRRRHVHAAEDRPRRVDRAHALYTLLVDLSAPGLLLTVPRLIVGTVLRALGFLLTKRVGAALDDVAALVSVLRRPRRLIAARRQRSASRQLPHRAARPLLAKRSVRIRHNIDVAAGWIADRARGEEAAPRRSVLETGPADDDFDEGGSQVVRRLLLRPGVALVLGLTIVAVIAGRSLLGSGVLAGGRLLPAGGGASDLWNNFVSAWHPVVTGTGADAPPYLAVLAVLSTVLLGKVWLAVDVLMIGCVPLAGLTAYIAASRLTRNKPLRVWSAASYALLPVATGAVASGRLGEAVAFIALPPLALAAVRLIRVDPRFDGWRHVGSTALLFAVVTAFAPLLYAVALPALLIATLAVRLAAPPPSEGAAIRRTLAVVLVAAAPLVLLWPWSGSVLNHPSLALAVPGPAATGLTDRQFAPWQLLVATPGGPGVPPPWLSLPLLLAGLAGLVRLRKRAIARGAWAVGLLALVAGIVIAHLRVRSGWGSGPHVVGWPGVPAAVIGAALLTAAVVAGDGARERLARMSFSWRQPVAGLVAVAAAAVPLMTGLAWLVRGAADPLDRGATSVLPAFAAAEGSAGARPRTLVLHGSIATGVSFDVLRGRGAQLGDADVRLRSRDVDQLSATVADLLSSRGDAPAAGLASYGIGEVLLDSDDPQLDAVLNRSAGLRHRTTGDIWELTTPTGRLVVLSAGSAARALSATGPPTDAAALDPQTVTLAAGELGARTVVPPGVPDRLLVLAESADDGWRAQIAGQRLEPVTAWGWAQAFRLPATGGPLRIWHSPGHRTGQLIVEAVLVGLAVLLAVPTPGGGRRTGVRDEGAL